jgi:hypothetical protein
LPQQLIPPSSTVVSLATAITITFESLGIPSPGYCPKAKEDAPKIIQTQKRVSFTNPPFRMKSTEEILPRPISLPSSSAAVNRSLQL